MRGTILWFNPVRKFGFILSQEDEKQYFVHQSSLPVDYQPSQEDCVEFDIRKDTVKTHGTRNDEAINVRYIGN